MTTTERIFAGKTALVTGGSRGIGRACCVRLARAGAKVAINYCSNEQAALETARLVEEAGGRVTDFKGDPYSPYQPHILATNGKIHDELLRWVNDKA